jgi:hypothetical protein
MFVDTSAAPKAKNLFVRDKSGKLRTATVNEAWNKVLNADAEIRKAKELANVRLGSIRE